MPDALSRLAEQFRNVFGDGSAGRLFSFVVLAGLILLCFIGLLIWSRRPDYRLLYSDLSPEDTAAVIEAVEARNVSYRVAGDGGAVLVPSKDVSALRIELAGKGIPQGVGVGFEIFDKRSFGMTSFQERLNYQRALQGELARTISHLEEVDGARVHLVMPEKSLFLEDRNEPSASVVVKLHPGRHLEEGQVQGIVRLVAGSVEGLQPPNVTVVDSSGRLLASGGENSFPGALTNNQMKHQQELERSLENRVATMLERVVGKGRVIARVSAVMDFTQVESTVESYDPDSTVVRSEQRSDERSADETSIPSGTVGTAAATQPGAPATSAEGEKSSFRRQEETINYEVSRVTKRVVEPTGNVERLSAAVLVDGTYKETTGEGGSVERVYVPRTPEEMATFESIVKSAIGFDETRGDTLDVASVPFEQTGLDLSFESSANPERRELIALAAKYGSVALVLVFVFFAVLRPLIRWLAAGGETVQIAGTLPKTVGELEQEIGTGLPGRTSQRAIQGVGSSDDTGEIARRDPEQVASIIRGWLGQR